MNKTFNYLLKGAFNVMKVPILFLLMVGIVVSLVRHRAGRLSGYASKQSIKRWRRYTRSSLLLIRQNTYDGRSDEPIK